MYDISTNSTGENGHYVQTEWGTMKIESPIPKLSPRYDFLKDPDIRQRLVKIKRECHYTSHKLKRKKNEITLLCAYLIIVTSVVTILLLNQVNLFSRIPLVATSIFLLTTLGLLIKMIVPVSKDIRYLKHKNGFLLKKQDEAIDLLSAIDMKASSITNAPAGTAEELISNTVRTTGEE